MSELNSPFLNNNKGENNINNKINSDSDDFQTESSQPESEIGQQFTTSSNEGEIEIKEDGKLLKNVIIIMIIILILSILGLILYNLIFNKKNEMNGINQQATQQMNAGTTTNDNVFEMEGKKFKAGSVVIE